MFNRRNVLFFVFAIALFALVAANTPAPVAPSLNHTMPVTRQMGTTPASLTPLSGSVTYNCPGDSPCTRTGSSEWFVLPSAGTVYSIGLFGGAQIAAAMDYQGEDVSFTLDHIAGTITFHRQVAGQVLLTITGPQGQNLGAYGVR